MINELLIDNLDYPTMGFPAIIVYRSIGDTTEDHRWTACLRNCTEIVDWDCKASSPNKAINKLLSNCVEKGWVKH